MQLHYLFSNKRVVRSAIIHFNDVQQHNAILVNDEKGLMIRRVFDKKGQLTGTETLHGKVSIELPAHVRGGPYKTKFPEA